MLSIHVVFAHLVHQSLSACLNVAPAVLLVSPSQITQWFIPFVPRLWSTLSLPAAEATMSLARPSFLVSFPRLSRNIACLLLNSLSSFMRSSRVHLFHVFCSCGGVLSADTVSKQGTTSNSTPPPKSYPGSRQSFKRSPADVSADLPNEAGALAILAVT